MFGFVRKEDLRCIDRQLVDANRLAAEVQNLQQQVNDISNQCKNLQQQVNDISNQCKKKDERIKRLENEVYRMKGRNLFVNL